MTVFAILMPTPQEKLAEAIKREFPHDHFALNETQWLVSTTGTTAELSHRLRISSPDSPPAPASDLSGLAVVFATSSYFGRAQAGVWDWLRTKLEGQGSG